LRICRKGTALADDALVRDPATWYRVGAQCRTSRHIDTAAACSLRRADDCDLFLPHWTAQPHRLDRTPPVEIARPSTASDNLLAAMLIGAGLLLVADWLSRVVIYPYQVPVGLFAALIGGPYLLWLLGRKETRSSL